MHIRQASRGDASRIAEIIVFNNRLNFFPIFQDESFSFGEVQVLPLANRYLNDAKLLAQTWVYDDGVVKGLCVVKGPEIEKLYVEPTFQNRGIGAKLLEHAVSALGASWLWALEKNAGALRFYARHGFIPTGERKFEEDTPEYLIKLKRQ
ncbi:MAG: GNAT family N-acetyltransferase [Clostridia bacterium]|nr:GNAT family N-acetyltransferase [Clostridia bacterium]